MSSRQVPCPTCRGAAEYSPANPYRPFCSHRCRNRDLGAWASESYRLPVVDSKDDGGGDDDSAVPDLH